MKCIISCAEGQYPQTDALVNTAAQVRPGCVGLLHAGGRDLRL